MHTLWKPLIAGDVTHTHTHTHTHRFNSHFSRWPGFAGCLFTFLLHLLRSCASTWQKPSLFVSSLTPPHCVSLGRPLCLITSISVTVSFIQSITFDMAKPSQSVNRNGRLLTENNRMNGHNITSKSNLGITAKRWLQNVRQLWVSVRNVKLAGPQCWEYLSAVCRQQQTLMFWSLNQ